MKRILSLVLAALVLLTCLSAMASCSQEAKTEEKSEEKTSEKTSAAKTTAPASTAAVTTQKPAPHTTKEPAPEESVPKPTAPQQPSIDLPASLKELSAIAIPNLVGTQWNVLYGIKNGEVVDAETVAAASIVFLDQSNANLVDSENTIDCNYKLLSSTVLCIYDDFNELYCVFYVENGVTVMALSSPVQEEMVAFLTEGKAPSTPSTPSTPSDPSLSTEELPAALKEFTSLSVAVPSDLVGTTWECMGGMLGEDEISADELGGMGLRIDSATSAVLLGSVNYPASLEQNKSKGILRLSSEEGGEYYGVFFDEGGNVALAIGSFADESIVLFFLPAEEGSDTPAPEKIPELLQSYLLNASPVPAIDGTTWILTGGEIEGTTLTPEILEAMGELSLSFSGNQVTVVGEGQSETADVQNNGRYLAYIDNDGVFYCVFLEIDGETVMYYFSPDFPDMFVTFTQK